MKLDVGAAICFCFPFLFFLFSFFWFFFFFFFVLSLFFGWLVFAFVSSVFASFPFYILRNLPLLVGVKISSDCERFISFCLLLTLVLLFLLPPPSPPHPPIAVPTARLLERSAAYTCSWAPVPVPFFYRLLSPLRPLRDGFDRHPKHQGRSSDRSSIRNRYLNLSNHPIKHVFSSRAPQAGLSDDLSRPRSSQSSLGLCLGRRERLLAPFLYIHGTI